MKEKMYAIIESGSRQYKIYPGARVNLDYLNIGKGNTLDLDKVLLVSNGNDLIIGRPYIKNARVSAICVDETKSDKVIVFKYKNKVRYRRKKGHRQLFTQVQIKDIILSDIAGA